MIDTAILNAYTMFIGIKTGGFKDAAIKLFSFLPQNIVRSPKLLENEKIATVKGTISKKKEVSLFILRQISR